MYRIYDKERKEYRENLIVDWYWFTHSVNPTSNTNAEYIEVKNQDNFIVEYSTGLEDKNWKEIYEWDCLEKDWRYMQILFGDGRFHYPYQQWNLCDNLLDARIVGNIHLPHKDNDE